MIKSIIFDLMGTLYNPHNSQLYEETISTLKDLKNTCYLILLTDLKKGKSRLIQELGLREYFDEVIIGEKSDTLFTNVMKQSNIDPSECMVIGDNEEEEIRIAKNLNMLSFLVKREKPPSPQQNTISNLTEINTHLTSCNNSNFPEDEILDEKLVELSGGKNLFQVKVYLKRVLVRNNHLNTKSFCKIVKVY